MTAWELVQLCYHLFSFSESVLRSLRENGVHDTSWLKQRKKIMAEMDEEKREVTSASGKEIRGESGRAVQMEGVCPPSGTVLAGIQM